MGWLSLVGAGISAIGQVNQARDDKENGALQSALLQQEANTSANKLRKASLSVRSTATSQLAASGIDVNSQNATLIDDKIARNAEADAYNVILTGQQQADAVKKSADARAAAGYVNAASTLVNGVASAYSGWKTANQAGKTGYGVQ